MPERSIPDMTAVLRVARRVNLADVWLDEVHAKRESGAADALTPELTDHYEPVHVGQDRIELACHHDLKVSSGGASVAEIKLVYRLVYNVTGEESITKSDAQQFATANGAYHSWPFAREMFFSLTSRMGYAPYVLPVLTIKSPPPASPSHNHKPSAREKP